MISIVQSPEQESDKTKDENPEANEPNQQGSIPPYQLGRFLVFCSAFVMVRQVISD